MLDLTLKIVGLISVIFFAAYSIYAVKKIREFYSASDPEKKYYYISAAGYPGFRIGKMQDAPKEMVQISRKYSVRLGIILLIPLICSVIRYLFL
jgi:hypothetical protein